MSLITSFYKKKLVCRYDKQIGIPYYSASNFPGLRYEEFSYISSKGIDIHYFYYYYPNYQKDKIILFCHGIGPGHDAYLKEIEWLAMAGYKVLTFDYGGCGKSGGKSLGSLYNPTHDAINLLDYLKIDKEIIVVGHSLGGFTALNLLALRKDIKKGVIISGFLSIPLLMGGFIKNKIVLKSICKYESKFEILHNKNYIFDFLSNTTKNVMFIHSDDDNIVPYKTSTGLVRNINNSHLRIITVNDKKHNPNYTRDAVEYMNATFKEYNLKLKRKELKNDDEKTRFFENASLDKMSEQDPVIVNEILKFIGNKTCDGIKGED